MNRRWLLLTGFLAVFLPLQSQALLTLDVRSDNQTALPIAIVPFASEGIPASEDPYQIIQNDLALSGRFLPLERRDLISEPHVTSDIDFHRWRSILADGLLIGKVSSSDGKTYQVQFQLFDIYKAEQLIGKRYSVPALGIRHLAHQIADQVYFALTNEIGVFSTRFAFVTENDYSDGKKRYRLQVSDSDGENPRTVLLSKQPILSPSWSPEGDRLTYVSLENDKPEIFVQDVSSGRRDSVASFVGIGNTSSWSPDGQKLAFTSSNLGIKELYILHLDSGELSQITHNSKADNGEPVWMPNNRDLVFVSDQDNIAQVYKVSTGGGRASPLTIKGNYHTSPVISPNGRLMATVHEIKGKYHIAIHDLEKGVMQVLGECERDQSLSFSPNGKMLVYSTKKDDKQMIAIVTVNGFIQKYLGEPASSIKYLSWSPIRK